VLLWICHREISNHRLVANSLFSAQFHYGYSQPRFFCAEHHDRRNEIFYYWVRSLDARLGFDSRHIRSCSEGLCSPAQCSKRGDLHWFLILQRCPDFYVYVLWCGSWFGELTITVNCNLSSCLVFWLYFCFCHQRSAAQYTTIIFLATNEVAVKYRRFTDCENFYCFSSFSKILIFYYLLYLAHTNRHK